MIYRLFAALLILLVLAACQPSASAPVVQIIPTQTGLAPSQPLDDALRVALHFLEAWKAGDTSSMYANLSFASQEATPYDAFTAAYQTTHDTLTLLSLDYAPSALAPNETRPDVADFIYAVTFHTRMLADLTDAGRHLQLVVDERVQGWRVAWSPSDIFDQLGGGAQLRLQISQPNRANIYDRNDQILADQNGLVVLVSAIKRDIPDWGACLAALAPALEKDADVVQAIYDRSASDWLIEFGTLDPAVYDQMHTTLEQVCAATFTSRAVRRYVYQGAVNGSIAPNIVGSVGYPSDYDLANIESAGFNSDSILGQNGVEYTWDEQLRGRPGLSLTIVSPAGEVLREIVRVPSQPSQSVWLTIDAQLQAGVSKILADAYANAKESWAPTSKGAAAVIMDVRTGEILAMVSYPSYDANLFTPFPPGGRNAAIAQIQALQADPRQPLLNRATQGAYTLGSVMKTVTALALLDSGVYALDTRYTCIGVWNRDITRYDWLPQGHGTQTTAQAITHSCNPFFYEAGYQLNQADPYLLPNYAHRFGLGRPTGLTDLGEQSGLIIDPDWKQQNLGIPWTFSDAVNMAIGQGEVQVTPLQVVRMFSAVANEGVLLRPKLVLKAGLLGEAPAFVASADIMDTVQVSPEVWDSLHSGLCAVTQANDGTAHHIFKGSPLESIGICGKTGTAQDGSSESANSHAWFAAYAPMNDPQIAVVVMVENAGQGSGVAAPIARSVLEYYFFGEKAR